MDLQPYLTRIATDLDRVTSLADESTRETSRRLAAALEPGLRLAMTELLADSAAELSARLGGTVIAVQMDGQQPEFQITETQPAEPVAPPESAAAPDDTDDGTARVTVRLPDGLKRRAETLAAQAQQSLNTWIVQAVRRAIEPDQLRHSRTTGRRAVPPTPTPASTARPLRTLACRRWCCRCRRPLSGPRRQRVGSVANP